MLWFFLPFLQSRFIAQDTAIALSWDGYGALLPLPRSIVWLSMLLYVAVAIGLYSFSASARLLFLLLTAFWAVAALIGGLHVYSAFGAFLGGIVGLGDGAMLALAYVSPLRKRFR